MADQDWKSLTKSLTQEALIVRLKSTEHDFVERKSRSQKGDWLQTAVAFANSAPIGWPAVLFVGVDDKGKPQQQVEQIEALIRSVSDVIEAGAFPSIYRHTVPLDLKGEGACLALIIPGSPERPHFAGQSYVRVGDSTKRASEEQFALMIAIRQSKSFELQKHIGKAVSRWSLQDGKLTIYAGDYILIACNAHYLTVKNQRASNRQAESVPLAWVELLFDHQSERPAICIKHL